MLMKATRYLVGEKKGLQQQPFGHKAVQRRKSRHGERADEGEPGDPRHAVDQPPQAPEVAFTRGVQNRPRAKKQQALHEGVIEAVIQERDEGECPHGGHADAEEYDRKAERGEDDAEILDRGVRE